MSKFTSSQVVNGCFAERVPELIREPFEEPRARSTHTNGTENLRCGGVEAVRGSNSFTLKISLTPQATEPFVPPLSDTHSANDVVNTHWKSHRLAYVLDNPREETQTPSRRASALMPDFMLHNVEFLRLGPLSVHPTESLTDHHRLSGPFNDLYNQAWQHPKTPPLSGEANRSI